MCVPTPCSLWQPSSQGERLILRLLDVSARVLEHKASPFLVLRRSGCRIVGMNPKGSSKLFSTARGMKTLGKEQHFSPSPIFSLLCSLLLSMSSWYVSNLSALGQSSGMAPDLGQVVCQQTEVLRWVQVFCWYSLVPQTCWILGSCRRKCSNPTESKGYKFKSAKRMGGIVEIKMSRSFENMPKIHSIVWNSFAKILL